MERTASTTKTDKFCEAICAFANDLPSHGQPGYLIIGVDDTGQPSDTDITDHYFLSRRQTSYPSISGIMASSRMMFLRIVNNFNGWIYVS